MIGCYFEHKTVLIIAALYDAIAKLHKNFLTLYDTKCARCSYILVKLACVEFGFFEMSLE